MSYEILAKDGRAILKDDVPIRAMDVTVEKIEQLDDTNKSFVAIASTEDEDRDKDIIRQEGWDLKNFKKNPMIPWGHNYFGVPIARSLRTWVDHDTKSLLFKPQFDADDEQSMKIFNKYKNGFLTSFSVGFRGIKFEYRDEDDRWWGGIEFLEQELLEISGVTIPANPNARTSFHGGDKVQNLLQLGYPTKFAETESGFFYPVRELGEFINPEIKEIAEGIQAVYANTITCIDKGEIEEPIVIGYYFDPNIWNTGEVKFWINDNIDNSYKFHYYDWKWMDKENDFAIEEKEIDKEIPHYDEPIKLMTTEDIPADDEDDSLQNETLLQITEAVEKVMKEQMNKLVESLADAFDEVFAKILTQLDDIKKLINEKELVSDLNLDNNDNVDDDSDPDKSKSKDNDEIEIDDSLISPDDDKSNSDETIEIDDTILGSKVIADTVNGAFRQKLKETFKSVLKIEI